MHVCDHFGQVEQNALDFVYTNPSIFSCLESEFQLNSLATLRNLALGKEVNVFGGVFFSKAGPQIIRVTTSNFLNLQNLQVVVYRLLKISGADV